MSEDTATLSLFARLDDLADEVYELEHELLNYRSASEKQADYFDAWATATDEVALLKAQLVSFEGFEVEFETVKLDLKEERSAKMFYMALSGVCFAGFLITVVALAFAAA